MSVERRLRAGLEVSASAVEVDVDAHLRRVLDRARRRRRIARVAAVAAAAAAVVAALVLVPRALDRGPTVTQREFTATRVLDAPRELVWRAWTEPGRLARWWGPRGFTVPPGSVSMDVRPGGRLRATMVADADGARYPVDLVFREVMEPERLVLAWGDPRRPVLPEGAGVATVTLVDRGGQTELVFHQTGRNTEEGHANARTGWSQALERLAEYIAEEETP
jgi:uncharacterized protein YndB with AHSA1/START domain